MLYVYNMSSESAFDAIFKALGDARRRLILDALQQGPRSTGQLCALFPALDRCTVMQHLDVLERANLLIVKRAGRLRWNYLNVIPLQDISDRWISRYAVPAVQRLADLRTQLEGADASADRESA